MDKLILINDGRRKEDGTDCLFTQIVMNPKHLETNDSKFLINQSITVTSHWLIVKLMAELLRPMTQAFTNQVIKCCTTLLKTRK